MSEPSGDSTPAHRGYHDIGGLDGPPVDRSEHVLEPWEKRVDALRVLLGDDKRRLLRSDGLRNAIETMGEDLYLELSYYERWMAAILEVLGERGVLEREAVDERVAQIVARLDLPPPAPRPRPRPR